MRMALNRSVYYFNTKLSWKEKVNPFEREHRERVSSVRQRESSLVKEERAFSPRQPYRKRKITRPSEESLTRVADIKSNIYQRREENNMSSVLNKLLDRLEVLEDRWETSQRPQKREDPNRS
jgi:hypothetical protein